MAIQDKKSDKQRKPAKELVKKPINWAESRGDENYLYTRYIPAEIRKTAEAYEREKWPIIAGYLEQWGVSDDVAERLHQDYRSVLHYKCKPLALTLEDMRGLFWTCIAHNITPEDAAKIDAPVLLGGLMFDAYSKRLELAKEIKRLCLRIERGKSTTHPEILKAKIHEAIMQNPAAAEDLEKDPTYIKRAELARDNDKMLLHTTAELSRYMTYLDIVEALGHADKMQFITPPPAVQIYGRFAIAELLNQRKARAAEATPKEARPAEASPAAPAGSMGKPRARQRKPKAYQIAPALAKQLKTDNPTIKQISAKGNAREIPLFDLIASRTPRDIRYYRNGEILPAYKTDRNGHIFGIVDGKRAAKYIQDETGVFYTIMHTESGQRVKGINLGSTPPADVTRDNNAFNICIPSESDNEEGGELILQRITTADYSAFALTLSEIINGELSGAQASGEYYNISISRAQILDKYSHTQSKGGKNYNKLNALLQLFSANEIRTDITTAPRYEQGKKSPQGFQIKESFKRLIVLNGHDIVTTYNNAGEELERETRLNMGILRAIVDAAPKIEGGSVKYTRFFLNDAQAVKKIRRQYKTHPDIFTKLFGYVISGTHISQSALIAALSPETRIIESGTASPEEKAKARRNISKHRTRTIEIVEEILQSFTTHHLLQNWTKHESERNGIVYTWTKAPSDTPEEPEEQAQ